MRRGVSHLLESSKTLIEAALLGSVTFSLRTSFLCSLLHLWKPLPCSPIPSLCSLLLLFRWRACPLCRRRRHWASFHHSLSRTNPRLLIEGGALRSPPTPGLPHDSTFA